MEEKKGSPEVMRLVGQLARLFKGEVRRACGENGVPVGYRGVLFHLGHCDGQTQKALADKIGLQPATVSITLDKMERDGYVLRQRGGADGREKRVYLTEKGKEIDRRTKEKIDALEKQFGALINGDERAQLAALLQKVIDGYLAQTKQAQDPQEEKS